MFCPKNQTFKVSDVTKLGQFFCCIFMIFGIMLLIDGVRFYEKLHPFVEMIGEHYNQLAIGISSMGFVMLVTSICGFYVLNTHYFRMIVSFGILILFVGLSTSCLSLLGYFTTSTCRSNPETAVFLNMKQQFFTNFNPTLISRMQNEFQCCGIEKPLDYYHLAPELKSALKRGKIFLEYDNNLRPWICLLANKNNCLNSNDLEAIENGCYDRISSYINRYLAFFAVVGLVIYVLTVVGAFLIYTIGLFARDRQIVA